MEGKPAGDGSHPVSAPLYRSLEEIAALVADFEATLLPRAAWTHAAHLTVALWYLTRLQPEQATQTIRAGIQRYNTAHGILTTPTGGYHETLTLFWIAMVRQYLTDTKSDDLITRANGLVERYNDPRLPFTYYDRERLFSREARANWLPPNLKPLPP